MLESTEIPAPLRTVVARPLERNSSRARAACSGDLPTNSGTDLRSGVAVAGVARYGILIVCLRVTFVFCRLCRSRVGIRELFPSRHSVYADPDSHLAKLANLGNQRNISRRTEETAMTNSPSLTVEYHLDSRELKPFEPSFLSFY